MSWNFWDDYEERNYEEETVGRMTVHGRERAKSRYGLELDEALHKKLVEDILSSRNGARKLGNQNAQVSFWYVHTPVGPANIVFDGVSNRIITFLPKGIKSAKKVRLAVIPQSRSK